MSGPRYGKCQPSALMNHRHSLSGLADNGSWWREFEGRRSSGACVHYSSCPTRKGILHYLAERYHAADNLPSDRQRERLDNANSVRESVLHRRFQGADASFLRKLENDEAVRRVDRGTRKPAL